MGSAAKRAIGRDQAEELGPGHGDLHGPVPLRRTTPVVMRILGALADRAPKTPVRRRQGRVDPIRDGSVRKT